MFEWGLLYIVWNPFIANRRKGFISSVVHQGEDVIANVGK